MNTNSCPKTFNKNSHWVHILSHKYKYYKREKLEKSISLMLFLKTVKDAKFVVDGNAFQTFITLSTKSFCLMLAVHLGLNSLYLWHVCTYVCQAEAFPATCSVLDVEPVQKTCAVIRVYDDVQCYAHFPQLYMTVCACYASVTCIMMICDLLSC